MNFFLFFFCFVTVLFNGYYAVTFKDLFGNADSDILNALPQIVVVPTSKDQIPNEGVEMRAPLTERIDMAHIELTTYLQRFPADYHYSMIAYKRILHMMLVRFSAKYLIYILSAEATVAKYPGHMSSILYEKIIRQSVGRFRVINEIFSKLKTGYNVRRRPLQVSDQERDFIFNRFATNTDNKRPLVRYYSYIAQLLMLDFDFLVHSYMVPAISQISRFTNINPKDVIKFISIQDLIKNVDNYRDHTLYYAIKSVVKEYEFFQRLPTGDLHDFYYRLMRQLEHVKNFNFIVEHIPDDVEKKFVQHSPALYNKLASILQYTEMMKNLGYGKAELESEYYFLSKDKKTLLYYERVPSELGLFVSALTPMVRFGILYATDQLHRNLGLTDRQRESAKFLRKRTNNIRYFGYIKGGVNMVVDIEERPIPYVLTMYKIDKSKFRGMKASDGLGFETGFLTMQESIYDQRNRILKNRRKSTTRIEEYPSTTLKRQLPYSESQSKPSYMKSSPRKPSTHFKRLRKERLSDYSEGELSEEEEWPRNKNFDKPYIRAPLLSLPESTIEEKPSETETNDRPMVEDKQITMASEEPAEEEPAEEEPAEEEPWKVGICDEMIDEEEQFMMFNFYGDPKEYRINSHNWVVRREPGRPIMPDEYIMASPIRELHEEVEERVRQRKLWKQEEELEKEREKEREEELKKELEEKRKEELEEGEIDEREEGEID